MTDPVGLPGQNPASPVRGGWLPPAVYRDLADLNGQFLALAITPGLEGDPRFEWAEGVRGCLAGLDAATLTRVAAVPLALFELRLPPPAAPVPARVEDSRSGGVPAAACHGRCVSFAHQALFMARRIVEDDVLVARLVLGLSDEAQQWLAACRLAWLAELAESSAVVRPRWRHHLRFWQLLASAAARGSPAALQWACCIGLCLTGSGDAGPAPAAAHRRRRR